MKKSIISIIIIIIISLAAIGGWLFKLTYIAQSGSKDPKDVMIEQGMGVSQISDLLHKDGVVENKLVFETYLRAKKLETSVKAGSYSLAGNLSVSKLSDILVAGETDGLVITIPEGTDLRGVAKILIGKGIITNEEDLYAATGYPANTKNKVYAALLMKYPIMKIAGQGNSVEGFLFPDTYNFYKNANLSDVLKKMFDNFMSKYDNEFNNDFKKSDLSLNEVLTLSSIVAREGKSYEDKQQITRILLNRIKAKMPLQCDSTINYITGKNTGNSSLTDIALNSPYNTYKNQGLPPGPINNPGLEDIKAVLNPASNDYYYFLSTKDGKIVYAKTFEEHKLNREKYGQ